MQFGGISVKTSQRGLAALGFLEGLRTKAYQDIAGVWTIGVGHTAAAGPPKPVAGMVITYQQALDLLARDLPQYEEAVRRRLPLVPQTVFDGAVAFCFNVGVGGFRKASWPTKYLAGQFEEAEAALKSWDKAGGRVVAGLVKRRAEEAAMIFRDKYPPTADVLANATRPVAPSKRTKPPVPAADDPPAPPATLPAAAGGVSAIAVGAANGSWWIVAIGVLAVVAGIVVFALRRG